MPSKNITITWGLISFSSLTNGKSPGGALSRCPDNAPTSGSPTAPSAAPPPTGRELRLQRRLGTCEEPHSRGGFAQRAAVTGNLKGIFRQGPGLQPRFMVPPPPPSGPAFSGGLPSGPSDTLSVLAHAFQKVGALAPAGPRPSNSSGAHTATWGPPRSQCSAPSPHKLFRSLPV